MQIIKIHQKPKVDRLDQFLVSQTKDLSRSKIQKYVKEGFVLVNKKPTTPNYRVVMGDSVELNLPVPKIAALVAENLPVKIIYEDDDLVVIDKAAGMVVHPTADHPTGTVVNWVLYHVKNLAAADLRPGIVHRIDKDTSGILVIAKNPDSLEKLKKQFATRRVKKKYLALVMGELAKPFGTIKGKINRQRGSFQKFSVADEGKEAETDYRLLKNLGKYSLVEVEPKTGRTHQIRVHFASLGHPIVADKLYGGKMDLARMFLHAAEIEFTHPRTGEKLKFTSRLPADLQEFLDKLS